VDGYAALKKIPGVGKKRFDTITTLLEQTGQSIEDLFKMDAAEIKQKFKLPINVAEKISEIAGGTVNEISTSHKSRSQLTNAVICVTNQENNYPAKLANTLNTKAPTFLYMWGNLSLLDNKAVGFCGSRNVSQKGLEVTADTVQQIVQLGWVVVSGHAKGVDTTAHRVALENGGNTIIVAAEGLEVFKLRHELKSIAKPEQLLIISQFEPKVSWTAGRAMQRNSTIIGLSDAMVLIESRLEGGTYEAGKTSLRLKMPLFVAQYEMAAENNAGNQYFIERGAVPFGKSKVTGRANIAMLEEVVQQQRQKEPATSELMLPGFGK
jgi:DNA protecting protein DprA